MLMFVGVCIAWLCAGIFAAVTIYLCLEILCGIRPLRKQVATSSDDLAITVLLPAHNEAAGIVATIADLRAVLPLARLLVVADNCSDDTSHLAAGAGADVVERDDRSRRGKGFALAFGRDHLRANPPDVVIVLDADCRLREGSGPILAQAAYQSDGPVQATNLLVSTADAAALESISNFAMLIKNLVRARGLMRIGKGIPLFGTGMAFPWPMFDKLELASGALAEDLELGLNLAKSGVRVTLVDEALVTSPAASVSDSREQRRRWEHGFLHQAMRSALPLIGLGVTRRSRHLIALGAHMLVPPVALHLLLGMAILALVLVIGLWVQVWGPFAVTLTAVCTLNLLLFFAWLHEGRAVLPIKALALAPAYVAWKIPIYLSFILKRQAGWTRTRRPDER